MSDDAKILTIEGDLDYQAVSKMDKVMDQIRLPQSGPLVIDLRNVLYMNSSGLALLLRLRQRAKTPVILANLSERIRSLFQIYRIEEDFFTFIEDRTLKPSPVYVESR